MKWGLSSWVVFALLFASVMGAAAKDSDLNKVPSDQVQWDHLTSSVKGVPEDNLFSARLPGAADERLYVAEAECSANAVALLSVNVLLPDAPKTVRIGTNAAWSGKTVVFLSRRYSGGRDFLFACLVDKEGRLERTRLLRPELHDRKFAIEIDTAKYKYSGK